MPFLISRIRLTDVVMKEDAAPAPLLPAGFSSMGVSLSSSLQPRSCSLSLPRSDIFQTVQNGSGLLVFICFPRIPFVFSLALCLFMAVSSVISTSFSLGVAACVWDQLYELLHASLLLVVPSCAVLCAFTRSLIQKVSSVQTLATHASPQNHVGHLSVPHPVSTQFFRCPLVSSSYFINLPVFGVFLFPNLVSTFLQLCFHGTWSMSWHVGLATSACS